MATLPVNDEGVDGGDSDEESIDNSCVLCLDEVIPHRRAAAPQTPPKTPINDVTIYASLSLQQEGEDDERVTLLCDGCDRAFHLQCLSMTVVPEGDWYCVACGGPHPEDNAPPGPRPRPKAALPACCRSAGLTLTARTWTIRAWFGSSELRHRACQTSPFAMRLTGNPRSTSSFSW